MSINSLLCNSCGATLAVTPTTRYVTCSHCQAHLRVHQSESSLFTEVTTEAEQLEHSSVQDALARLDQEWQREREKYMVIDRYGRQYFPEVGASNVLDFARSGGVMYSGIPMIILGLAWIAFAIWLTGDAPIPLRIFVPLVGALFCWFGLSSTMGMSKMIRQIQEEYEQKAAQYQQAHAAYQARRKELEQAMDQKK